MKNSINVSVIFQDDAIASRVLQEPHSSVMDTNELTRVKPGDAADHILLHDSTLSTLRRFKRRSSYNLQGQWGGKRNTLSDPGGFAECDVSPLSLATFVTLIQE